MEKKKVKLGIIFSAFIIILILTMFDFKRGGEVADSIIINEDPRNLVLTVEDMGEEWILNKRETGKLTENNGYKIRYDSVKSSPYSDHAFNLFNDVWVFNDSESAIPFINKIQIKFGLEKSWVLRIGDETYYSNGIGTDEIAFRENNVVVRVTFFDSTVRYTGEGPKRFAKILEEKIKKAAEEQ